MSAWSAPRRHLASGNDAAAARIGGSAERGWRPWLLGSGLGRARGDAGLLLLIFVLAFLVRLVPVLAGGGLTGLHDYDDGVYFGSAIALTQGVLPYRDFLLLHPPGEAVALLPFGFLGDLAGDDVAFALARLATMGLGAVSAVLAALVAGRHLRLAGIAAGLLYATWSAASNTERSTDLHALQAALLLAGLLVLVTPGRIRAGRAVLAGVPLGLATSVQLWQGLAVAVLLVWVAIRAPAAGRRLWARLVPPISFGTGAVLAFVAVCLPFFVSAPWDMVRYILVDQVSRPGSGTLSVERLRALEGLPRTGQLPAALRPVVPDAAIVLVALAAAAVLVATARRCPWTRPWAVLAVAGTLVVMVTPSFFNDYVAFVAPAATLVLGTGVGWVGARLLRAGHGRVLLVAGSVLLFAVGGVSVVRREGQPLDIAALRADLAGATCVNSDHPTLLVVTGALRHDLEHRCPIVLDPTGIRHDADRASLPGGLPARTLRQAVGYQAAMVALYGGSDAGLFTTDAGFTAATRAAVERSLPYAHDEGIVTVRRAAP